MYITFPTPANIRDGYPGRDLSSLSCPMIHPHFSKTTLIICSLTCKNTVESAARNSFRQHVGIYVFPERLHTDHRIVQKMSDHGRARRDSEQPNADNQTGSADSERSTARK